MAMFRCVWVCNVCCNVPSQSEWSPFWSRNARVTYSWYWTIGHTDTRTHQRIGLGGAGEERWTPARSFGHQGAPTLLWYLNLGLFKISLFSLSTLLFTGTNISLLSDTLKNFIEFQFYAFFSWKTHQSIRSWSQYEGGVKIGYWSHQFSFTSLRSYQVKILGTVSTTISLCPPKTST